MEYRSVVPEAKAMRRFERGHVSFKPLHTSGSRTEPSACLSQHDSGHVEHGESGIAGIEQAVNERGGPPTNIDNASILAQPGCSDERQSKLRAALIPAHVLWPLGLINVIPVLLTVHVRTGDLQRHSP
jgi:hypothetical protein